jgi:hypothetical protein
MIEGHEVPISESTEKWSELTLEDGTVLRVKAMVMGAIRIEGQWDPEGNPLYALRGGAPAVNVVSIPDRLKRPGTVVVPKKAN